MAQSRARNCSAHPGDLHKVGNLHKGEHESVLFHSTITKVNRVRSNSIEAVTASSSGILSYFWTPKKKVWYFKSSEPDNKKDLTKDEVIQVSYSTASREVVSQELFRLFIPGHQKTRLVVPGENRAYYGVISEEIEGYKPFSDYSNKDIIRSVDNGALFGLGEVLVIALLVMERDLKPDNLAVNKQGQVLKLDGEFTFNKDNYNSDISAEDIASLPYLTSYEAGNWLDVFMYYLSEDIEKDDTLHNGRQEKAPLCEALAASDMLRDEINFALLKVMLMPQDVLRDFVKTYVDKRNLNKEFIGIILEQKKVLSDLAMENASFQSYLLSDHAENDINEYIDYLAAFKTAATYDLKLKADGAYMIRELHKKQNKLRPAAVPRPR